MDFGKEGRKEGQGWVRDRFRCNGRSWAGLVGRAEGGPGGRLMVSELSPQLWGRHWEMTGDTGPLKQEEWSSALCVCGD